MAAGVIAVNPSKSRFFYLGIVHDLQTTEFQVYIIIINAMHIISR